MRIQESKSVPHDMRPVKFAYRFAQRRAIKFGRKLKDTLVRVNLTNCGGRGYGGHAKPWRNEVLLRFGKRLPAHVHEYARFSNMPTFWISGREESIVYLAAHEFGHLIGWGRGE